MAQYRTFLELTAKAKRAGWVWDRTYDPVLVGKNGVISYKSHYRVMFQLPFLHALFGDEPVECLDFFSGKPTGEILPRYHYIARELVDMIMDEDNQTDLLAYLDGLPTAEEERTLHNSRGKTG